MKASERVALWNCTGIYSVDGPIEMDRKHTPRKSPRPIIPAWTHPRELSDAELLDLAIAELENRERRSVLR